MRFDIEKVQPVDQTPLRSNRSCSRLPPGQSRIWRDDRIFARCILDIDMVIDKVIEGGEGSCILDMDKVIDKVMEEREKERLRTECVSGCHLSGKGKKERQRHLLM